MSEGAADSAHRARSHNSALSYILQATRVLNQDGTQTCRRTSYHTGDGNYHRERIRKIMSQRNMTFALIAATGLGLSHAGFGATEPDNPMETVVVTVSGLNGPGLVIQYASGVTQPIDANGEFRRFGMRTGGLDAVSILTQPQGAYCTASNTGNGSTARDTIFINVDCISAHRLGGNVTGLSGQGLRLRRDDGASLAIAADGDFTFPGVLPADHAYEVTIEAQPDQSVCEVSRGVGRIGVGDVSDVAVTCRTTASGFAYVLNTAAKNIAIFRIDAGSGKLTAAGNPVPAGKDPLSLTIDPLGRFAYVANYGSNNILVYRIDRATGALTAAATPIAMGDYPISIALDPAGRFAYVANSGSGSIGVYRVDPSSGALSAAGNPVATGAFPIFITLDPAGRFAYVVNYGASTVSSYRVDAASGMLASSAPPAQTGAFPFSITLDPAGRHAYVANSGANTVSSYRLDPDTGALISTGTPVKAGADPQFIGIDPAGRYAYVTNYSSNNISVYRIDPATGALRSTGAPVTAGGIPISLSMAPDGKFAYVATLNAKDNISTYRVNPKTGRLAAVGTRGGANWFSFTER